MKTKVIIEFKDEGTTLDRVTILASLVTHFEKEVKPMLKTGMEMSDIYFEHIPDQMLRKG